MYTKYIKNTASVFHVTKYARSTSSIFSALQVYPLYNKYIFNVSQVYCTSRIFNVHQGIQCTHIILNINHVYSTNNTYTQSMLNIHLHTQCILHNAMYINYTNCMPSILHVPMHPMYTPYTPSIHHIQ